MMGSNSDWSVMQQAAHILKEFAIPHEALIVSAHRTPDRMFEFAETAIGVAYSASLRALAVRRICLA